MKKKLGNDIISSIFVLTLIVGTFFIITLDIAAGNQDGDYTYIKEGGVATIMGYTGAGGAITIPSTLGGFSTIHIGDSAFNSYNGHLITSVIIPNSVTTIGNYTFDSCASLTSVTIPDSVTTIGIFAFSHCTSLTSVTIPESVTTIGKYAFYTCSSLTSVTLSNNITIIGNGLFDSCFSLASVTIPDSITTIGKYAFYSCFSLTSVTMPNSVTTIGNSAFQYCSSLNSVIVPDSVTTIRDYAFSYCASLTSITFQGLAAPTTVDFKWILGTPTEIRGHAYATSNFPAPGDYWHGLKIGTYIPENNPPMFGIPSPLNDSTGNSLSLIWSISIIDFEGDRFNWMVQCSNGQSAYANNTSNGTKPLSLSGLASLTKYTILVNATDSSGSGLTTWKWYTFTTKANGGGGTPTAPIITGPRNGTINTTYTYTVVSTDPDNDTLQYTFIWGDSPSIPQSSGYLSNGTGFTMNRSWAAAGRYNVTVTVTDNQTTSSLKITIYINALQIGEIGYFLDTDDNGIYDAFYSDESKKITKVQKKNSDYTIDSDGNGDWDYTFDATKGLLPYKESPKTPGFTLGFALCAIVIVILFWKRNRPGNK